MDVLMGTRIQLATAEGPFWRTLGGETSPHDLETTLQLVHMLFRHRVQAVPAELRTCLRCVSRSRLLRSDTCWLDACQPRQVMGTLAHVLHAGCLLSSQL